jgi:hypothetical protein
LVESAICILLFVTMALGILGFGVAIFSYSFISHAAREGTRYAMVHGANCSSCNLTSAQIASYVTGIAPPGISTSAMTVDVYCGAPSSTPPTGDCGGTTSGTPNDNPGNVVYVKVIYSYSFLKGFLHINSISMTTASERVIWQ